VRLRSTVECLRKPEPTVAEKHGKMKVVWALKRECAAALLDPSTVSATAS